MPAGVILKASAGGERAFYESGLALPMVPRYYGVAAVADGERVKAGGVEQSHKR